MGWCSSPQAWWRVRDLFSTCNECGSQISRPTGFGDMPVRTMLCGEKWSWSNLELMNSWSKRSPYANGVGCWKFILAELDDFCLLFILIKNFCLWCWFGMITGMGNSLLRLNSRSFRMASLKDVTVWGSNPLEWWPELWEHCILKKPQWLGRGNDLCLLALLANVNVLSGGNDRIIWPLESTCHFLWRISIEVLLIGQIVATFLRSHLESTAPTTEGKIRMEDMLKTEILASGWNFNLHVGCLLYTSPSPRD